MKRNIKKRKSTKRKTGKKKIKVNKYQIKTFIFDVAKKIKDPKEIDEKVNEFLKTVDVKEEDNIDIDQGEGYIRVSIVYKVKVDKV